MINVHNREKLEKARDFRKRGFTYSEISNILGVSRGTLSNWLSKQPFSRKVRSYNEIKARKDNARRLNLLNKARAKTQERQAQAIKRSAKTEFKHYRTSPLFMLGLGLYLAVGDTKHRSQIRLPSQRSEVHKRFQRFLVEFLGAERQKIYHKNGVTIFNDILSKQKLLTWIDLVP